MIKKLVVCVLCLLAVALLISVSAAQGISALHNYTADMVTTTAKDTYISKIYFKDGKQRTEGEKRSDITITRFDKKLVWMLMTKKNMYMEISLDTQKPEVQNIMANLSNLKTEKEFVGTETVDGHPCKKYHLILIKDGKREKSGYTWEATDLNNLPVKYQSEDNKWTTIWKNIKQGGVSDSLFEIPSGYTKMDLPSFGGKSKIPKK